MQNRSCTAGQAGYVALTGSWACPRCGCANDGCDSCNGCGWNRCGCQGGFVRAAAQTACGCVKAAACNDDKSCDECPASFTTGHSVQRCPDNTRIRRDEGCGCDAGAAAYQPCGKAPCGDNTETYQRRSCRKECGGNGGTPAYQTCGCNDNAAAPADGRNARVGIVHGAEQKLADVFESESALRTGTLFPELHKPMNGRCPACSNCSTCGQQSAFAAWDLRLYLNTHPDDKEALALFRRLCGEADDPNYATAFLEEGCGWNWTDDPWPWECTECGD